MYSNSLYDPFGFQSPYFGDPFSSSYEHRRRQETARRQRLMEEERRRKAEYERRRRLEERLALEEQRRLRDMEMLQRERQRLADAKKQSSDLAPGTIVRGVDGNLYRVVAPPRRDGDEESAKGSFSDAKSDSDLSVSTENKENEPVTITRSQKREDSKDLSINSQPKNPLSDNEMSESTESVSSMEHEPLHEIIVEDVPDDEDEELRDMHSVWRNRIPDPGQWMQPVESFCGT